jgi:hypothetical protein
MSLLDRSKIKKLVACYVKPDGTRGEWPARFASKDSDIIEFEHDFDMLGEWTVTMKIFFKNGNAVLSIPQKKTIAKQEKQ